MSTDITTIESFGALKRPCLITFVLLLLVLSACHSPQREAKASEPIVEFVEDAEMPDSALSAIDSLMWTRPDSALALLQSCRDAKLVSPNTPNGDSLETHSMRAYNGHYYHLLLAELLYKNDYEQTNRPELQQAVAYFDSLTLPQNDNPKPRNRHCGRDPQSPNRNATLFFLAARAHYINGIGYYERDSVVEACKEYLKALEVMEGHFEEKELVGKKAQFMTYIYNRLGDIYYDQLLVEPAISCYKQALVFCMREPTSIYGISVILYNLGIQFDIDRQKDSADYYYNKALDYMPDFDNIHYRDIVTTKSVLAYNMGSCADSVINNLKHMISFASNDDERITRFLTLGNVLFEDKQYDSSCFYLETVFEQQEDIPSRILAADNLCSIYQMKGDSIKAQYYASFLAGFTMSEIEQKTEVSKVNEMFKDYLSHKQVKQAEKERERAIRRVIKIIIPIAVVVAFVIFIVSKQRSKKLLKKQHEEADRRLGETELEHKKELEAERQTHRMERAVLSVRLKRSNQEVRELKDQIKQLDDLAVKTEAAASFNEEPICRLIMKRVNEGQFKSKIDYLIYKDSALDKQQVLDLRMAVDRHFRQFTVRLKKAYPELTNSDLDYCCLYLLGLNDADIAALKQRAYNTVVGRGNKIQNILGNEKPLPVILMDIAQNKLSV